MKTVSVLPKSPIESVTMNAAADVMIASRWTRAVEDTAAKHQGRDIEEVRPTIAQRLGTTAKTLKNLREQRRKTVPNWLMARIRTEFVAVLQNEIGRLEHEITIARQIGMDHRDDDLAKAEAQVREAKAILGK